VASSRRRDLAQRDRDGPRPTAADEALAVRRGYLDLGAA
jgi:hypothetical protein